MNGDKDTVDFGSVTAATVDGEKISLAEVLRHAKTNNGMAFLKNAVDGFLIDRAAERAGITVKEIEIDTVIGRLKDGKDIDSDAQMAAWLNDTRMSQATLRENMRRMVRFGKLKSSLTEATMAKLGAELLDSLDYTRKGVLRDLLFLQWLDGERATARIELCLLQKIG